MLLLFKFIKPNKSWYFMNFTNSFHCSPVDICKGMCSITLHVNCKIAVFREHSSTYHGKDGHKG